ncbi:MAG TPA: hypothetical protein VLK84_16865 [Longimicrobium sp.]|nr:hypothetical protein [Longimicrobium sp.]
MPERWYFDWLTFWVLGGMTLWEGVRRVPAGAVLLRHVAGYTWHPAGGPFAAAGWRLASWLSPLVCHVMLAPGPGDGRVPPRRLARWTALLRVSGALAWIALVVGVPLLTASAGLGGFILAAGAAVGASVLTASLSGLALRRMAVPWKTALRDGAGILSPFAAPRAAEVVLERALEGVGLVDALRALLPPAAFAEWVRPLAYDQARGGDAHPGALLPAGEAAAILQLAPAGSVAGDVYCARCGRVYLPTATACRACDGVEMIRVAG